MAPTQVCNWIQNRIFAYQVIAHLCFRELTLSRWLSKFSGIPCNPKSFVDGFQPYVENVYFAAGCVDVACGTSEGFPEAIRIAQMADVVVVVAGLDLSQETEDLDRVSLLLPGKQMDLIAAVVTASKRPVILVLTGGGPLDVSFAKEEARIAGILWVGYPGETGGIALAEIIFGEYNPGQLFFQTRNSIISLPI